MATILLVDDELDWLRGIRRTLAGYDVAPENCIYESTNGAEALRILRECQVDLILLDLFLENESGEDLLREILRLYPLQNIIMMTGSNSVENAVNCIKKGAKDYFVKSTPVEELMMNVKRLVKIRELEMENEAIKKACAALPSAYEDFQEYITCSPQMFALFGHIRVIAKSSHHILITGESGVGKGLLARLIARMARPGLPFVSVNVAGYDEPMLADALFGHAKGAYTGADAARDGMIRQAKGGVLFLDEVGDLSPQSQTKLLYLLQDKEYQPLGSDRVETVAAKLIFASNRDLPLKVREHTFRSDLFFRLNTHRIHIPALRNRREDIPLLVQAFADQAAREFARQPPAFTDRFMDKLSNLLLPGNIRQLRSIVHDLVSRHDHVIDSVQLSAMQEYTDFMETVESALPPASTEQDELPTLEEITNQLVLAAVKKAHGNQVRAARLLGISQPTLSRKLKKLKYPSE